MGGVYSQIFKGTAFKNMRVAKKRKITHNIYKFKKRLILQADNFKKLNMKNRQIVNGQIV
jgi:hypothetical protein